MENQLFKITDDVVKEQVRIVVGLGNRTMEETFKLGGMLVQKKAEKGHGNWLPYLKIIGIGHKIATRLMKAFRDQDKLVEGMTFSELVDSIKYDEKSYLKELATVSDLPQEPDPVEPPRVESMPPDTKTRISGKVFERPEPIPEQPILSFDEVIKTAKQSAMILNDSLSGIFETLKQNPDVMSDAVDMVGLKNELEDILKKLANYFHLKITNNEET